MKKLFFLWGILIPMPAVAINFGSNLFALANIILIVIIAVGCYENILKKGSIIINNTRGLWYAFCISSMMTLFVSFFTLNGDWLNNSVAMTIKNLAFIVMILIVFSKKEVLDYRKYFIRGLYYSSVINLGWSFLQMYFGYVLGININEVVFADLLHLDGGVNWNQNVANNIVYRMSGLSWEPANFGLIANVGYVLSRKTYLKIVFAISILLSTSKMGMVCLAIILMLSILHWMKEFKYTRNNISFKQLLINMIITPIVVISLIYYYYDMVIAFVDRAADMINLLSLALTTIDNDSANIHKLYYEQLFNIYSLSDISNIIFGYGMFCAGYPYAINNIVLYTGVWNPESDFVTLFVGNGILGGLIYYLILIRGYVYNKTYEIKSLLLIIFVAGILYLQCKGWLVPLVILSMIEEEKTNEKKN